MSQSSFQPTPLTAEERARAEVSLVPYVTEALTAQGRWRASDGRPELTELYQQVARRVGERLRRPVISYSDGRETVITFGVEADAELDRSAPRRPAVT
ncbi:MAG: hypothetical protein JO016_17730 [Actinobacteria bacterium]|nr:hypothetical protein [Actinomycetota bacterium]